MVGPNGLIDTGPSWAADSRLPDLPDPASWDSRDTRAEDPRDTGTWAAVGRPEETPEPDDPFPRGRGGWRARDTGGWEAPDTGSWDPREVERAARNQASASRTEQCQLERARHGTVPATTVPVKTAALPATTVLVADNGGQNARAAGRPHRGWSARIFGRPAARTCGERRPPVPRTPST